MDPLIDVKENQILVLIKNCYHSKLILIFPFTLFIAMYKNLNNNQKL